MFPDHPINVKAKKTLFLFLLLAAAVTAAVFFPWRLRFLEGPLLYTLKKVSGQEVSFSKVVFKPINRISIYDLKIGQDHSASIATVYLSPLKYLKTRKPVDAVRKVIVYAPELHFAGGTSVVTAENIGTLDPGSIAVIPAVIKDIIIIWDNGRLWVGDKKISGFGGMVRIKDGIKADIRGQYKGGRIRLGLNAPAVSVYGKVNLTADYESSFGEFSAKIFSNIRNSNDISAYIEIPKVRIGKFELLTSSGNFNLRQGSVSATMKTTAGNVILSGTDFTNYTASAAFNLANALKGYEGIVEASYSNMQDMAKAELAVSSIAAKGIEKRSLRLSGKKNSEGGWDIKGTDNRSKYSFSGSISNELKIDIDLKAAKSGIGNIYGSLAPVALRLKLKNWGLEHAPVLESRYPGIRGTLQLEGDIAPAQSKFKIDLSGIKYGAMAEDSIGMNVMVKDSMWFVSAISGANGWAAKVRYLDGKDWEASVHLDNSELAGLSPWIPGNHKFQGKATGAAAVSAKGEGTANLSFSGIVYNGNIVGDAVIEAALSSEYARIDRATLYTKNGKINIWGHIGLSENDDKTKLNVNSHQLRVAGRLIDGRLLLQGQLNKAEDWQFSGTMKSGKFRIDNWLTKKLTAGIKASKNGLRLTDFVWEPLVKGKVSADFKSGTLDGAFVFEGLQLENVLEPLKGRAKGILTLKGNLKNPDISLSYTSQSTIYKGYAFDHAGSINFNNGLLSINDLKIQHEKGSVRLDGSISPDMNLRASIVDFPLTTIRGMAKIKNTVSGVISGEVGLKGSLELPEISVNAGSKNIVIDDMEFREFSLGALWKNRVFVVDHALVKYLDSELKLLPDSYIDLKKAKFKVVSECRNIHLGPFDAFGELTVTGDYKHKVGKNLSVNSTLSSQSLWLNQYNLTDFRAQLKFDEGVLTFIPKSGNALKISGIVDLNYLPQIKFYRMKIASGIDREFLIDGEIGRTGWDFMVSGKNMDIAMVAELTGFTEDCSGSLDLNVVGKGSLEHPQIEASIDISNGSISDVPYDSMNFQLSARQDVITILKSRLFKQGQFSIIASGYSPFYLTEEGAKRNRLSPIDLSVTVEEGSLVMLKGLTSDIVDAKGSFRALTHITGSLARPVVNGYFKTQNGFVESKRYFSKLNNLNVDLLWRNNLLTIKEFTGKIGEGALRIKGKVFFSGFYPGKFDLNVLTEGNRGIPISIPELPIPTQLFKSEKWNVLSNLSNGQPRFSIKLTGPASGPLLSGWVDLENTHFTYPSLASSSEAESALENLWPLIRWDLELRAAKNTWYDNELVSANISGSIKLGGRGEYPNVSGHIESNKGSIVYFGSEFAIKNAALDIVKNEVFLEGRAETEVYGASSNLPGETKDTIQLIIDKAEISKINPRFVSKNNPELSPENAMARATGIDPKTTSSSDMQFYLRKSIIRFLDSTLTTPLAKNLLKRSGIVDSFRVQYVSQETIKPENPDNPSAAELLAGTKYSFEKYLNDRVLFDYSMIFDELSKKLSLRHELGLSYNLMKDLYLKGKYELESKNPLRQNEKSIMLEQHWRFGLPKKKSAVKTR